MPGFTPSSLAAAGSKISSLFKSSINTSSFGNSGDEAVRYQGPIEDGSDAQSINNKDSRPTPLIPPFDFESNRPSSVLSEEPSPDNESAKKKADRLTTAAMSAFTLYKNLSRKTKQIEGVENFAPQSTTGAEISVGERTADAGAGPGSVETRIEGAELEVMSGLLAALDAKSDWGSQLEEENDDLKATVHDLGLENEARKGGERKLIGEMDDVTRSRKWFADRVLQLEREAEARQQELDRLMAELPLESHLSEDYYGYREGRGVYGPKATTEPDKVGRRASSETVANFRLPINRRS